MADDLDENIVIEDSEYSKGTVLGHGSFGIVYESVDTKTGEPVAIKAVYQDKRYKNRELQIMKQLSHPNVVKLNHFFYHRDETKEEGNDLYLNIVMEFIPDTIYRITRNHTKAKKLIPIDYVRVYVWQMCRSLWYIHSKGVCHRDIKPQNLLLDPQSHIVKLCDFGSAKILVRGQPNVAYICSRFYRAPELIFGATDYTTDIDIWSLGCVFAEMLIGYPLFAGESSVDQLVEIIKILGTPTKDEILAMNPNYNEFKFPQVKPHPWSRIFRKKAPEEAIDLISKFLVYRPTERVRPLEALAHKFFDPLREADVSLPDGKALPPLFNFVQEEIEDMKKLGLLEQILPKSDLTKLKESDKNTELSADNRETISANEQSIENDNQ